MKKRQKGLTTVEAAIGAGLMLILLFGAIEVARAIFVWNFMDEVARRGARVAAVCPFNHPGVREAAIFADALVAPGDTQSPHVAQLTSDYVHIEYLDSNGDSVADSPTTAFTETKFVRASIEEEDTGNNLELPLLFFKTVTWTLPKFTTILPSENLGFNPGPGVGAGECRCFGTSNAQGCGWKAPPS